VARLEEQLAEQLGPALRAAADETDHGFADDDVVRVALRIEDLRERLRFRPRIVRFEVELGETELVVLLQKLVDPVPRRMHLEPVSGVRRNEGPPARVLLDPEIESLGPPERLLELVLVEHETDVIDARNWPLTRLDDNVDGPLLELGEAQLEAFRVELFPRHAGLERREVLADAPVARDEVEAELADIARLDLADAARDEVVVEQLHCGSSCQRAVSFAAVIEEVDAYIEALEEPKRGTLAELRRTILEVVPEAEQVISYRVPAFRVGGKTVAGFAAFTNHLSYLPFSGSVLPRLADELTGYTGTKSALHFPLDEPLPKELVEKLIAARLEELG